MHSSLLTILPLVLSLTAALPTYNLPIAIKSIFEADETCTLPAQFQIEQLQEWTPEAGNNNSATVNFAYWDNSTQIQTICHFNETSENVAPNPDLTPRYACDDPTVEFIWQYPTLTIIEKACE
jgi:hypothetical protein